MEHSRLRALVERSDAEAKILRGWELYQAKVRSGEMKEIYNFSINQDNVPSMAWNASWLQGRRIYHPRALEIVKDFCVLRKARLKAKRKYEGKELDVHEVKTAIYHLAANRIGEIVGNRLRGTIP